MPTCNACGHDCPADHFTRKKRRCDTCTRAVELEGARRYREQNQVWINAKNRAKKAEERGYSDPLRSVKTATEEQFRHQLIRLIDENGALCTPDIAKALGIANNAAAGRILVLLNMGLVRHEGFKTVNKRQSKLYKLTMDLEEALQVKRIYKGRTDKEQASAPPSAAVSLQSVWR